MKNLPRPYFLVRAEIDEDSTGIDLTPMEMGKGLVNGHSALRCGSQGQACLKALIATRKLPLLNIIWRPFPFGCVRDFPIMIFLISAIVKAFYPLAAMPRRHVGFFDMFIQSCEVQQQMARGTEWQQCHTMGISMQSVAKAVIAGN